MPATFLHSLQPAHGTITPDYLEPHDLPWLAALLEAFSRFEGRPRRELDRHLREPLPCPSPKPKRDAATEVLHTICRDNPPRAIRPAELRAALFTAAARARLEDPERTRHKVAKQFAMSPQQLDASLFADFPPERRMSAPPSWLSPRELAARTNLHIAQRLLRRAAEVVIDLRGNVRGVVRLARLRGLIVTAERASAGAAFEVRLAISGPLVLFRKTIVYGRALASLLLALAWCDRFRLHARCFPSDRPVDIEIRTGDPIFPGEAPRRFDSRLEERFAREFAKATPDWDLIREPEPIELGGGRLMFPDFAIVHRRDRRRWLLEIVGFWTPQYLDQKLASLRAARLENFIVCVDSARGCAAEDFPANASVVRYKTRILPTDILALIEVRAPTP